MQMKVKLSLFLSFFLLFHNANPFNITQILSQYPDFSTFNSYLTQANLASQINSRETITVLAVENSNLSPLSGKPLQVLTNILSVHVILDYFDVPKLQKLPNGPTTLTTLFQTTGFARGQQGFLNVTHLSTSSVAFGSAVAGSTPGSNLVKSVFTQPYNISVLQVSNAIVPPGVDGPMNSPAPAAAPSASPGGSQTPARAPSAGPGGSQTPTGAPSVSPGGSQTPSMSPNMSPHVSPQASPSTAPPTSSGAPAPSETLTPPAATPVSSPTPNADAPAADGPAPEAPASDSPNAGTTLHVGLAVVCTVVVSTICLASGI